MTIFRLNSKINHRQRSGDRAITNMEELLPRTVTAAVGLPDTSLPQMRSFRTEELRNNEVKTYRLKDSRAPVQLVENGSPKNTSSAEHLSQPTLTLKRCTPEKEIHPRSLFLLRTHQSDQIQCNSNLEKLTMDPDPQSPNQPLRDKKAWMAFAQVIDNLSGQAQLRCTWPTGERHLHVGDIHCKGHMSFCGYSANRPSVKRHIEARHLQIK